jgi:hypothetical protein
MRNLYARIIRPTPPSVDVINVVHATDNAVIPGAPRLRPKDAFPSPAEAGDTHARSGMDCSSTFFIA